MVVLGLSPGPQVRQLVEGVREAQAEGLVRTREEAVAVLRAQPPGSLQGLQLAVGGLRLAVCGGG
jgi:hypothetical protein